MASMAAAIAAARTSVMSGNRPLDEKERNRFAYFSSLNSMAKKIMQDKERIRERYGADWDKMPPREQDEAIDKVMVDPQLQARYALHRGGSPPDSLPPYPVLRPNTGQKEVHFGEEDVTWKDEHSAPFSWETRSQMEFSIASLSAQDAAIGPAQSDLKQTPKQTGQNNQTKTPHGNQNTKAVQGSKTPNCEGSTSNRKEEESAFWKISMERSRIEGSQSEFQSLTPSQIKSIEKGEKPLPNYYRQDSFQKEKELARSVKTEKPAAVIEKPIPAFEKPLAPAEKQTVVTKQPKTTNHSLPSVLIDFDRPRPSQSSMSTLEDVFLPEPAAPIQSAAQTVSQSIKPVNESSISEESQRFSQINTSSVLLKTGFDFLDNW
uniref:Chromosome 1 open reading frame 198 n=1 Tax=Leptobrachium leishanense TaxID=445787 RepID=A0A8C5R3L7_9ANUR